MTQRRRRTTPPDEQRCDANVRVDLFDVRCLRAATFKHAGTGRKLCTQHTQTKWGDLPGLWEPVS